MADSIEFAMYDEEDMFEPSEYVPDYVWITKRGHRMDMWKMNTYHLINCRDMLRRGGKNSPRFQGLMSVLGERGVCS